MLYLLNRLLQAAIVLAATAFLSFIIVRYIGDPVNNVMGQSATLAEREAMRHALGLDQSVPAQFLQFLRRLLSGDLGVSYRYGQSVAGLIQERLPASLELSLCSMLIATGFGIPLGIWTAVARNSALAKAVLAFSVIGV